MLKDTEDGELFERVEEPLAQTVRQRMCGFRRCSEGSVLRASRRKLDLVDQLIPLATEVDATLSQYAIAWILRNDTVTAPLLGPRTLDQLDDNLRALDVTIPPEHLIRIDSLVPTGTRIGDTLG